MRLNVGSARNSLTNHARVFRNNFWRFFVVVGIMVNRRPRLDDGFFPAAGR